ncbi:MAG TPA: ABC transporter permease [Acidimicrobiales bacterium]|nr:ABC transporter permease [Acidimicrobiales bacterium]
MTTVTNPAAPAPAPAAAGPPGWSVVTRVGSVPAGRRRLRYAAGRVIVYLFMVWVTVTVVFALPRLLPGDPLESRTDINGSMSPERHAALTATYHLDRPLVTQYRTYLTGLVHGDFGVSIARDVPVGTLLRQTMPWTLLLVGAAIVLSSAVGFAAGTGAAWKRGGRTDRELLIGMTVLNAVPEYVLAVVLLIVFVAVIPVAPIGGGATPFTQSYGILWKMQDVGRHLALPVFALSLGMMATKFLLVRNTTVGELGQEYMVAARAKGLSPRRMRYRHAGRNVLLPFVTVVGLQVAFAAGGALFVETVFAYPGVASIMLPAVNQLDFPVIEATFTILAVTVLTANLVVDLLYARLDPRVATA